MMKKKISYIFLNFNEKCFKKNLYSTSTFFRKKKCVKSKCFKKKIWILSVFQNQKKTKNLVDRN
jgi:hypothetical protein